MSKRARWAQVLTILVSVALIVAVATAASGSAALGRAALGWPWTPGRAGPGAGAAAEADPAVLAYQPKGPAFFAGTEAELAGSVVTGLPPVLTANSTAGVWTTAAPAGVALSGNLTPTAVSAVLMEAYSGQVLYAKNPQQRRPIASVTKIMTLCLILDAVEQGRVRLEDMIGVSENAWHMGGSQIWLEPGEQLSLRDMLVAIAVGSANDACVAVAEHLSGSHEAFVEAMNRKAQELGMRDTHFVNAYGLDAAENYSTAYDVALMARYAAQKPKLLEFTSIWIEYLRDGKLMQANTNRLVRHYRGCDGLKTGWTNDSGHCLAATAMRDGTRLISVVLGCTDSKGRFAESSGLLNAGFSGFVSVPVARRDQPVCQVRVERGTVETLDLVPRDDFGLVLPKGEQGELKQRIVRAERIYAPVQAGQTLAELVVEAGGKEVGRAPLVARAAIARAGFLRLVWRALSSLLRSHVR